MPTLPYFWSVARQAWSRIPGWGRVAAKAWLIWFWRLSSPAKIAATAVEIILMYAVVMHLPGLASWRTGILEYTAFGLCLLALAGILFGGPKKA